MEFATKLLERNVVPDWLIRRGIRRLLGERLRDEEALCRDPAYRWEFVQALKKMEIAISIAEANEQHYEVPTEFYDLTLGPAKKYSSCYYATSETTLQEAEMDMLGKTIRRGRLEDGMTVLDLGCGWGSVSLYIAKHFPKCKVTSVSNSWTQKKYIDDVCRKQGYRNVEVETGDVNIVSFFSTTTISILFLPHHATVDTCLLGNHLSLS